eukprot:TRINITY_DN4866_c0_g1_i1.p1 TRINITY_DN4866_c0_g1~~TRINITY_DN4866_c0_g1_i1.p1  ORF type:complete len:412 (-),score=46.73 TRINITY_DN4866_c0_g1_i1:140-1375(-)
MGSIDVMVWNYFRIPYVYIFQFDPRDRLTEWQIFDEAVTLSIVWLINALFYISHPLWFGAENDSMGGVFDRSMYPLGLFVYSILKFFNPFMPFQLYHTQTSLLKSLKNVIISPFGDVRFLDSFVADVLTSMVKVMQDIAYACCYYFSFIWQEPDSLDINNNCDTAGKFYNPAIIALPFFWRFAQCLHQYYYDRRRFPYISNAAKYTLSYVQVMLASIHPEFTYLTFVEISEDRVGWEGYRVFWLLLVTMSTVYAYIWDLTMDWNLLHKACNSATTTQNRILRPNIIYPRAFYFWLIISNFFLRFAWIITLVPADFNPYWSKVGFAEYSTLIIIGELIRRFQWGIVRVEVAYHKHFDEFRAYSYIPAKLDNAKRADSSPSRADSAKGVLLEIGSMFALVIAIGTLIAVLIDS